MHNMINVAVTILLLDEINKLNKEGKDLKLITTDLKGKNFLIKYDNEVVRTITYDEITEQIKRSVGDEQVYNKSSLQPKRN